MKLKALLTKKIVLPSKIQKKGGHKVLTKTEDFRLYAIRDKNDEILGTILLTDGQFEVLNNAINPEGIFVTTGK